MTATTDLHRIQPAAAFAQRITDVRKDLARTTAIEAGFTVVQPSVRTFAAGTQEWAAFNWEIDPLVTSKTLAIPKRCAAELLAIERTGVNFDQVVIAHEVEQGTLAKLGSNPTAAQIKPHLPCVVDPKSAKAVQRAETVLTNLKKWGGEAATTTADLLFFGGGFDPLVIGLITADPTLSVGSPAWSWALTSWIPGQEEP